MNGKDVFNTFELQNECIFDQEIDSISTFKANILVSNREWHLSMKRNIPEMQFVA